MHYRAKIWVNQYNALMGLHLANGCQMGNMEHQFGQELSIKWERLDYGKGPTEELMLYTFHDIENSNTIKFKVSTGPDGFVYDLIQVVERGIILCHGKEDFSINTILKKLLWPVTLAFDTIWFD